MLEKYLEFLKTVFDRSGAKPIYSGGVIYAMYLLADKGLAPGTWVVCGMVAVTCALFIARHLEKINDNGKP